MFWLDHQPVVSVDQIKIDEMIIVFVPDNDWTAGKVTEIGETTVTYLDFLYNPDTNKLSSTEDLYHVYPEDILLHNFSLLRNKTLSIRTLHKIDKTLQLQLSCEVNNK